MSEVVLSVLVEEKFKIKIEKLAEKEQRSLAGQVRWILEKFFVDNQNEE